MNILQFIEEQYPIKDRIKERLSDPYKRIMEMDDLPYDIVGPDENGNITKLVEIDDIRTISVVELVALDETDVKQLKDPDLEKVWKSYMSLINIKDYNVMITGTPNEFDTKEQFIEICNRAMGGLIKILHQKSKRQSGVDYLIAEIGNLLKIKRAMKNRGISKKQYVIVLVDI